jgi:hypothetical protein
LITRREKLWTRRNTESWSDPCCTWRWRDRTSSSWSACAHVFSLRHARLIIKPSSGSLGTFILHPSLVFGFWHPHLFLFTSILMWIMLVVMLRGSPLRGLVSSLDLLLCLGLLASSLASPNPPQKLSMLLLLLVAPSCFGW